MEGNKDEAIRCLGIARKHSDSENWSAARKFCQKSIALFATPEAEKLLASIVTAETNSSTSAPAGGEPKASGTETHPSAAGAKQRHVPASNGTAGGMGGEKREYTVEQHAVVKRVRACKVSEYYEILAVKRDCEDSDIKKAYRKVRPLFLSFAQNYG